MLSIMHIGKLSMMCGSQVVSDVICRFTTIFVISRNKGSIVLEQFLSYVNSMHLGRGGISSSPPSCAIILLAISLSRTS
jgi:hypothetical protein